jgi:hypothetical protein
MNNDFIKEMEEAGKSCAALPQVEKYSSFELTEKGMSTDEEGKYILIGKGYYEN